MNTEKQEVKEVTIMVEDALLQLKNAIKSQEEQSIQTARKTSYMIRYGLVTITLLSMSVVFLVWSQNNDMKERNEHMQGMASDISIMSNAIVKMQANMSSIEGGINQVVIHTQSINGLITQKENLVTTLSNIAGTVELMQSDAHGWGKSMENVNYNLGTINKQMKSLNRKLGTMVQDVNRMPSPTRMFPF